jgi:DNA-binding response OmpR family regulator
MYLETKHLLVIDGDAGRRRQCERLLGEEGFAMTAVAEGFSAIRAAARRRFALAVIAVDLPGTLDGIATRRQLRARQPWLRALFTGQPAQRPPRLDCDRDDFIAATFYPHELRGCVFELLQREPLFRTGRDLAG